MSIHRLALSFARDFLPLPDHRKEIQKPKDKAETKQRHPGRGQVKLWVGGSFAEPLGVRRHLEDDGVVGVGTTDTSQRLLAPRESSIEAQRGYERKYCVECPRTHAFRTEPVRYDPGAPNLESRGALPATHDFDDLDSYHSADFIRQFCLLDLPLSRQRLRLACRGVHCTGNGE